MINDRKSELQTAEGKLLEKAMRRRRLQAPAVAKDVGVSTETVRNWIKGYRSTGNGTVAAVRPDEFVLAAAAHFLGISAADLTEAGRADAAEQLAALGDRDLAAEFSGDSTPLRRLLGIRDEIDAVIDQLRAASPE